MTNTDTTDRSLCETDIAPVDQWLTGEFTSGWFVEGVPYAKPDFVHVEPDAYHDGWSIYPVWLGVDREHTGGWGAIPTSLMLRLVACLNAGKGLVKPMVCRDINGASYVQATHVISGKYMDADLKQQGF